MSKVRNLMDLKLDKRYWLIGYDLPAESRNNLTEEQKTFLNSMRLKVARDLRGIFRSVPFQKSFWILREPDRVVLSRDGERKTAREALDDYIAEWRGEYAEHGFEDVSLEVWPIGVDSVGDEFIRRGELRFLFDQLGAIEERVDKCIKAGVCKLKVFQMMSGALSWTREVFVADMTVQHPRWFEFEKNYNRIQDKLEEKLRKMVVA